jgi:hypothetical protein
MYKYIRLFGCKISSFFNYIVEIFSLKRKKYKKHDDDDDDISYDSIYDDDIENVFYISLVQE